MSDYHFSRDGTKFGPYTEAVSRQYFSEGNIVGTDLVWCEGMPEWRVVNEIFGLQNTPQIPSTPVFCCGCGKKIHENASTCPNCGAPQKVLKSQSEAIKQRSNELESISESWKVKFNLLEKAGGVKLPKIKDLSFGDRAKIAYNIWAFLFGPFYYFSKGMWKKAISLLGVSSLIIIIIVAICRAFHISDMIANFVAGAVFSSRATIDYYKKVKLEDNGWW